MPPKKGTKRKPKAGGDSKRRRKKSFSSDSEFDSDPGNAKSEPLSDNNHHNNQHLDEDNGLTAEDLALAPKLPEMVGRLLVCGGTNWDLIGRKELPKAAAQAKNAAPTNFGKNLWGPHRTPYRIRAMISSCTACHQMIVTEDGKVMTWGRNDKGQLGHGDTKTRHEPTVVRGAGVARDRWRRCWQRTHTLPNF